MLQINISARSKPSFDKTFGHCVQFVIRSKGTKNCEREKIGRKRLASYQNFVSYLHAESPSTYLSKTDDQPGPVVPDHTSPEDPWTARQNFNIIKSRDSIESRALMTRRK